MRIAAAARPGAGIERVAVVGDLDTVIQLVAITVGKRRVGAIFLFTVEIDSARQCGNRHHTGFPATKPRFNQQDITFAGDRYGMQGVSDMAATSRQSQNVR